PITASGQAVTITRSVDPDGVTGAVPDASCPVSVRRDQDRPLTSNVTTSVSRICATDNRQTVCWSPSGPSPPRTDRSAATDTVISCPEVSTTLTFAVSSCRGPTMSVTCKGVDAGRVYRSPYDSLALPIPNPHGVRRFVGVVLLVSKSTADLRAPTC